MNTPIPTISHDKDITTSTTMSSSWRLGLDIGVGSLGWAVLDLKPMRADEDGIPIAWEPYKIRKMGVTIFPSGLDVNGASANTERRKFRSTRRHFMSTKRRKHRVLQCLIAFGCIEANEHDRMHSRDRMIELPGGGYPVHAVWANRWIALRLPGELPKLALGMILMALTGARGIAFSQESESKNRLEKSTQLDEKIRESGAIAFGDYAADLLRKDLNPTVRAKNGIDHYLSRDMVIWEFDALRSAQATLLSSDEWDELREAMFDRPSLAPPRPGPCSLVKGEHRIAKAHPDFQDYKIIQTLRNIRIEPKASKRGALIDRLTSLEENEIQRAFSFLKDQRHATATKLFDYLGLSRWSSNFHQNKVDIPGDETGALMSDKNLFGERWFILDVNTRRSIVERALAIREKGIAPDFCILADEWDIPEEAARRVLDDLPRGRGAYGPTATATLLSLMRFGDNAAPFYNLSEARLKAYPRLATEQILTMLPYYGKILVDDVMDLDPEAESEELRHGKVRNPVVHVALNQVRTIVNALCKEYGKPKEIVVELAREMRKNEKEKLILSQRMKKSKENRDNAAKIIRELRINVNDDSIERYLLWEELGPLAANRRCPYSLRPISSIEQLFNECEVEHIIPRSRCGDDSFSNKTVVYRDVNRGKKNATPYEFFGGNSKYPDILKNAESLFGKTSKKYKRFLHNAAENFCGTDFINRQLTDTAYISRLTRQYLCALGVNVDSTRGTITGRLRKAWRLAELLPLPPALQHEFKKARENNKDLPEEVKRHDHRHHAIDAVLVGLIDRQCIEKYFRKTEQQARKDLQLPWDTFRDEMIECLERVTVRHRRPHKSGFSYTGELLEASRYRQVMRDGECYVERRTLLRDLALSADNKLMPSAEPWNTEWLDKQWIAVHDTSLIQALKSVFSPENFNESVEQVLLETAKEVNADVTNIYRAKERKYAQAVAWQRLCNQFSAQNSGRSSITSAKKRNDAILIPDRKMPNIQHAYLSGRFAYTRICTHTKKGKKLFSSHPVRLIDAARQSLTQEQLPGEVIRLHQGDMLRIIHDGKAKYLVVRSLRESGKIGLALHNNGNGSQVESKKYRIDQDIEGARSVDKIFGEWRARIIRLDSLGRV